jgi:hypothetical protein
MAELATWALRLKGFSRKRPPTCQRGRVLGNLSYTSLCGVKVTVSEIWSNGSFSDNSCLAAVRRSGGIGGLILHSADFAGDVTFLVCRGADCALHDIDEGLGGLSTHSCGGTEGFVKVGYFLFIIHCPIAYNRVKVYDVQARL